uniref:UCR_hinge domain-containing protein n=1 Tax=Globodera pallida TaxID=36090 RepID=A0A183BPX0_GLOPA
MLYPAYHMKQFAVTDPYELRVDSTTIFNEEKLTEEINVEQEMQAADLRDKQRSDAKNALEEYCFKLQHTLEDERLCKGKVSDEERHGGIERCNAVLEWLDTESDTLQRKQIECRHNELDEYCRPIIGKIYAVAELDKNIDTNKMETASPQQSFPNDKQKVKDKKGASDGQIEEEVQ